MNLAFYASAPVVYYLSNKAFNSAVSDRSEREDLDESILLWCQTAKATITYQKFDPNHPASDAVRMVNDTIDKIEYIVNSSRRHRRERYTLTKFMWPSNYKDINDKLHKLREELQERLKILLKLSKLKSRKNQ